MGWRPGLNSLAGGENKHRERDGCGVGGGGASPSLCFPFVSISGVIIDILIVFHAPASNTFSP